MAAATCVVGVDIGGTWLRLRAEDVQTRERTATVEVPVPRSLDDLATTTAALARRASGGRSIESVAVGLPGQVLDNRCVWIPNLRFLDGIALADLLSARLEAPCHLINDAQATLLAETQEGAAQGRDDVVLVAVGTGIGGAIQVGGHLVRGANGCAGSFGWLTFAGSTRDEDHGQWERVGSGQALESLAAGWGGVDVLLRDARSGQEAALGAVTRYGAILGEGIAALASILDPEIVVFAGGLTRAADLLHDPISSAVVAHGSPSGRCVRVVSAQLGGDAGVIGALRWARECRSEPAS